MTSFDRALLPHLLLLSCAAAACTDPPLVAIRGALQVEPVSAKVRAESSSIVAIDFGEAALELAPVTAIVRLRNVGEASIGLGRVEWPDASNPTAIAGAFALDLPASLTLVPGATVDVSVSFRPSASGVGMDLPADLAATVLLHADGAKPDANAVRLELRGTALANPCGLPESLDFGAVSIGREVTRSFLIANPFSTGVDAQLSKIAVAHSDARAFRFQDGTGSVRVPPQAHREITITFAPQAVGLYSATATIRAAPGCEATSVKLRGEGKEELLTVRPALVDCGWIWPGQEATRDITFHNQGLEPITVSGARIEPSDSGTETEAFVLDASSWSGRDRFELGPGERVTRSVRCAPETTGKKVARLSFLTDAPGEENGGLPLTMIAGGPDIELEPARVDFGKVAVVASGPVAQTRRFVIRNVGWGPQGELAGAALVLGTLGSGGERTGPYFRVEALNAETEPSELHVELSQALPPGGLFPAPFSNDLEVILRLAPVSAGAKRFRVFIASNDPDEPEASIEITAEALLLSECRYQLSATHLDFGIVHVTAPKQMGVVFENLGEQSGDICLLSQVELNRGTPPDYKLVEFSAGTVEVAPGARIPLVVELQPKRVGSEEQSPIGVGSIQMQVSSPTAPTPSVSLTGATGPACMAVSPDQLDFGTVPPAQRSAPASVRLINICQHPITLHRVTIMQGSSPAFELTLTEAIPVAGLPIYEDNQRGKVAAGNVVPNNTPFSVSFVPQHSGPHFGAVIVEVTQNFSRMQHVVPLRGNAEASGLSRVVHRQGGGDPVDIIMRIEPWLPDNGGVHVREGVAGQVPKLLAHLAKSGNDFKIGVLWGHDSLPSAITEHGTFETGSTHPDQRLFPHTPDLAVQLVAKIDYGWHELASRGGQSGWRMYQVWRSLVPPTSTRSNAGFLRDGARLAILFLGGVGTEAFAGAVYPTAPGIPPQPDNPGKYAFAFAELKGVAHPERLSIGALGWMRRDPTLNPRCSTGNYDPNNSTWLEPLNAMKVLLGATRGTLEEACPEDWEWPAIVESMAEVASGLKTRFRLGVKPDLSKRPIEVKVDGVRVLPVDTQGNRIWNYEAERNAVRFELARTPNPGQRVELTFETLVP